MFGAFYDSHAPAVSRYFARRTFDAQAVLDLTAETFAQAFESRRKFRGRSEAEAQGWVFGIAAHLLSRYLRRGYAEQRLVRRLGVDVPEIADETERVIELAGVEPLSELIKAELTRLNPEQRTALELRVVQELPFAEVASRLGTSQKAARMRVARALTALSNALEKLDPVEMEAK